MAACMYYVGFAMKEKRGNLSGFMSECKTAYDLWQDIYMLQTPAAAIHVH